MLKPSKSQPFSAGRTLTWNPWVGALSSSGRRNTLRGVLLQASYQVDTSAAGILAGEDLAKFFKQITINDVAGMRRHVSGEGARIMGYLTLGAARMAEMADIAASQTDNTGNAFLYVPFEHEYARGTYDCLLPADLLRTIQILCPDQTTLDLVAGTTIDSVDYTVWADVREDDNVDEAVSFFSRDIVSETIMETATQGQLELNGALLAEAVAYSPGADGGASMANWTSHQLIGVEDEPITAAVRLQEYRFSRAAGDNLAATQSAEVRLDPITAGRAAIVHLPPRDFRMSDLPFVKRALKLTAVNSVTTPTLLVRTIEPDDGKSIRQVAQAYGAKKFYARTAGKTARDIKGHGQVGAFLPKKGRKG